GRLRLLRSARGHGGRGCARLTGFPVRLLQRRRPRHAGRHRLARLRVPLPDWAGRDRGGDRLPDRRSGQPAGAGQLGRSSDPELSSPRTSVSAPGGGACGGMPGATGESLVCGPAPGSSRGFQAVAPPVPVGRRRGFGTLIVTACTPGRSRLDRSARSSSSSKEAPVGGWTAIGSSSEKTTQCAVLRWNTCRTEPSITVAAWASAFLRWLPLATLSCTNFSAGARWLLSCSQTTGPHRCAAAAAIGPYLISLPAALPLPAMCTSWN